MSLSTLLHCLRGRTHQPKRGAEFVDALEKTQGPLPSTLQRCAEAKSEQTATVVENSAVWETLLAMQRQSYVQTAVWIVAQLADGLQRAHDRSVLHRDIKPSNVLIGADGQPLLLDFNVSEDTKCDPSEASIGDTIAYMAPEQLKAMLECTADRVRQHARDIVRPLRS